jgi:lyso-ornithine lipid O-acyltransferase
MLRKLRITLKLLGFALWSIPIVLTQMLVMVFTRGPAAYYIPYLWHRGLCWIFGLTVRVVGTPADPTTPMMFVSNHASHFDIFAIGSVVRGASFVAKNDVAKWPIAGFMANLQQTAYISRHPKHALQEKNSLQSYLRARKSIILFPEGTTNHGYDIFPFKSSLFALALEHELTDGRLRVQPFSLRILPKSGATGAVDAQRYPWAVDDFTPMAVHMMNFLGGRGVIIELVFHDVIDPRGFDDRKVLCETAQKMVVDGHLTGMVQNVPSDLPLGLDPRVKPEDLVLI